MKFASYSCLLAVFIALVQYFLSPKLGSLVAGFSKQRLEGFLEGKKQSYKSLYVSNNMRVSLQLPEGTDREKLAREIDALVPLSCRAEDLSFYKIEPVAAALPQPPSEENVEKIVLSDKPSSFKFRYLKDSRKIHFFEIILSNEEELTLLETLQGSKIDHKDVTIDVTLFPLLPEESTNREALVTLLQQCMDAAAGDLTVLFRGANSAAPAKVVIRGILQNHSTYEQLVAHCDALHKQQVGFDIKTQISYYPELEIHKDGVEHTMTVAGVLGTKQELGIVESICRVDTSLKLKNTVKLGHACRRAPWLDSSIGLIKAHLKNVETGTIVLSGEGLQSLEGNTGSKEYLETLAQSYDTEIIQGVQYDQALVQRLEAKQREEQKLIELKLLAEKKQAQANEEISFDKNSSELNGEALATLSQLALALDDILKSDNKAMLTIWCTEQTTLSAKRAESIKKGLIRRSVPEDHFQIERRTRDAEGNQSSRRFFIRIN